MVLVDGLFGLQSELRPQRSSNAYRLLDPLKSYKTEFPTGPLNRFLKNNLSPAPRYAANRGRGLAQVGSPAAKRTPER